MAWRIPPRDAHSWATSSRVTTFGTKVWHELERIHTEYGVLQPRVRGGGGSTWSAWCVSICGQVSSSTLPESADIDASNYEHAADQEADSYWLSVEPGG